LRMRGGQARSFGCARSPRDDLTLPLHDTTAPAALRPLEPGPLGFTSAVSKAAEFAFPRAFRLMPRLPWSGCEIMRLSFSAGSVTGCSMNGSVSSPRIGNPRGRPFAFHQPGNEMHVGGSTCPNFATMTDALRLAGPLLHAAAKGAAAALIIILEPDCPRERWDDHHPFLSGKALDCGPVLRFEGRKPLFAPAFQSNADVSDCRFSWLSSPSGFALLFTLHAAPCNRGDKPCAHLT